VLDFALSRSKKQTVHVTAALIDGRTALTIADEGGAIPEEARHRLFEPFAETEFLPPREAGQRRRNRLGLGLAITRGILTGHGREQEGRPGARPILHIQLRAPKKTYCAAQSVGRAPRNTAVFLRRPS